eukprot:scaffold3418_cov124-Isochrysis_galbana.AAC.24
MSAHMTRAHLHATAHSARKNVGFVFALNAARGLLPHCTSLMLTQYNCLRLRRCCSLLLATPTRGVLQDVGRWTRTRTRPDGGRGCAGSRSSGVGVEVRRRATARGSMRLCRGQFEAYGGLGACCGWWLMGWLRLRSTVRRSQVEHRAKPSISNL